MAPRTLPSPLTTLSTLALQAPLLRLLRGEVERRVVEEVREYLTSSLPPSLQSSLLVHLVAAMEHRSPHLVLLLLLTPSLRELTLHLTAATREGGEVRVSEGDMAACLAVMEEQLAASRFASLEKVVVVDRSEDPDFQGDPINNMANTNSPPEVWGDVLPRLSSLSSPPGPPLRLGPAAGQPLLLPRPRPLPERVPEHGERGWAGGAGQGRRAHLARQ